MAFLDEHDAALRLYAQAVTTMGGLGRLREALRKANPDAEEDPDQVESAEAFELKCKEEASFGYPLLVAHSAVTLWSCLESTVPEFVRQFVLANPAVLDRPQFQKLKISAAEALKRSPDGLAIYVVEELERSTQNQIKWGVGRFDEMISALGLAPKIEEETRRTIFELSQIRNVIAHNRSVVDSRLVNSCPWLNVQVGQKLVLNMQDHHRYSVAVCTYAADILEAG